MEVKAGAAQISLFLCVVFYFRFLALSFRRNRPILLTLTTSERHILLMFRAGTLRTVLRTMSTQQSIEGPIQQSIHEKLTSEFQPTFLQIANDSYKHASHHGMRGASNVTESHFRIEIVSEKFQGKAQPARHRLVYAALDEEIKEKGVHALQMKTKTPQEYSKTTQ